MTPTICYMIVENSSCEPVTACVCTTMEIAERELEKLEAETVKELGIREKLYHKPWWVIEECALYTE